MVNSVWFPIALLIRVKIKCDRIPMGVLCFVCEDVIKSPLFPELNLTVSQISKVGQD